MKKGFSYEGKTYDSVEHFMDCLQKTHEDNQKKLIAQGEHELAKELDDMHKESMAEARESLRLMKELQLGRKTGSHSDTIQ